jgi:hypothetical protein
MESYKNININLKLSIFVFILWMLILLFNCRDTELEKGAPGDPIRGNGLLVNLLTGGLGRGFGSGGSGTAQSRFSLIKQENNVYAVGQADSRLGTKVPLLMISNSLVVSRFEYDLPNCTPSSSSTSETYCRIITLSASGDQAKAIGTRIVVTRGSGETTVEATFYLGTSSISNLSQMTFQPIDSASIGLSDISRINIFAQFESATDGTNFVFRFPNGSANERFCGTNNNGGSWNCITQSNIGEFVRNFGGTLAIGARRRWNGTTFVDTTATNSFRDAIQIASRVHFPSSTPQFTDTVPSVWTNPIPLTSGTFGTTPVGFYSNSFELNGNPHIVFNQDSGSGSTFTRTFYIHRSTDSGLNYSLNQTLGGEDRILGIKVNSINIIGLGSRAIGSLSGQDSNNFFQTKLVESTDLINWTEFQ